MLWSLKEVQGTSPITWWFEGYLFSDTLESALLLLLRQNYFAVAYEISRYLESLHLVLATVPNRWVSSGSGSDLEPNRCNGSYHTKTRTVAIGPVLPPKTLHYKSTIFPAIQYLSSDRIVT
jgi:hypothetical protein